jgi:imidazole glycerol phosphate synthase subunit HisF
MFPSRSLLPPGPERWNISQNFLDKKDVKAALAAGILHQQEVPIKAVRKHMRKRRIERR